jgi:septal ring factor EnvC (AmiA/AmiB activator)
VKRARAPALLFCFALAAGGARAAAGAGPEEPARDGEKARGAEPARAQEEAGAELEALRRAIEEHRERKQAFEREERGLLDTLEAMDRALDALESDARAARREAEEARLEVVRLEGDARALTAAAAATRRALGVRAAALYKAGELGPMAALLGGSDLRAGLDRAAALQRLLEHDRALLARYRDQRAALAAAREGAARAALARDAAVARLEERAEQAGREREAREQALVAVRADRRREREALAELEAAARLLEEKLAGLGAAPAAPGPRGATPFSALRGLLDPPVDAPIVVGFGPVHDEFGTRTFRKGVELAAPAGAAVRAVADGVVRFAGWFRGYGKIVILDHGDSYFTVSGHLDEVAVEVGDVVSRGARIASAGATGSLSGPRLYFEVRRGGEALDPAAWLRGARRAKR